MDASGSQEESEKPNHRPFLIGVSGGTASGKVRFVLSPNPNISIPHSLAGLDRRCNCQTCCRTALLKSRFLCIRNIQHLVFPSCLVNVYLGVLKVRPDSRYISCIQRRCRLTIAPESRTESPDKRHTAANNHNNAISRNNRRLTFPSSVMILSSAKK